MNAHLRRVRMRISAAYECCRIRTHVLLLGEERVQLGRKLASLTSLPLPHTNARPLAGRGTSPVRKEARESDFSPSAAYERSSLPHTNALSFIAASGAVVAASSAVVVASSVVPIVFEEHLHEFSCFHNDTDERRVHIDTFSAMNGISRFCESDFPWRYSKEEQIKLQEFQQRNFTFLINEHPMINGFKCLFTEDGFSRVRLKFGFPPILMVKEPKVYVHGNLEYQDIVNKNWPGCP
uniref:Uncharacterized protein n=1 Tax=Cajanus cajan TaxID=3821 RepID=A0A151RHD3_CAJCA|nr:hypothetical protein KK1_036800 [Cajanus cajan]